MKRILNLVVRWLGWVVAAVLAAMKFVETNPLPTDPASADSTVSAVLRVVGLV
jgi:hypothetical protein